MCVVAQIPLDTDQSAQALCICGVPTCYILPSLAFPPGANTCHRVAWCSNQTCLCCHLLQTCPYTCGSGLVGSTTPLLATCLNSRWSGPRGRCKRAYVLGGPSCVQHQPGALRVWTRVDAGHLCSLFTSCYVPTPILLPLLCPPPHCSVLWGAVLSVFACLGTLHRLLGHWQNLCQGC